MKKLICIIVSVIIILCSVSFASSALSESDETLFEEYVFSPDAIKFDPTTKIEKVNNQIDNNIFRSFYAESNPDSFYNFYSTLNYNQMAFYDKIYSDPFSRTFTFDLINDISGNCTKSGFYYVLNDDMNNQLSNLIIRSIIALGDDHPELFWLQYQDYDMSIKESTIADSGDPSAPYYISIKSLSFTISLNSYTNSAGEDVTVYKDISTVQSYYNQLMSFVNNFQVKGNTRYDKVKHIHDTLCNMITYDLNAPMAHEPTGALISPYHTVCEGYAEAFKLLCNKAKIPSLIIVGYSGDAETGGHAWNYVKMEDGLWYAVDSTWDDQVSKLYYDYFLVGSASTNRNYNNNSTNTFEYDHTPTGSRLRDNSIIFAYPPLSTTSYSSMMLADHSTASVSKAKSMVYINSGTTVLSMFNTPYGYTISSPGNSTNSIVTIKTTNGTLVSNYTVVMYGDLDANAVANYTDYLKVKQISVGLDSTLTDAEFEAGDLNKDGVIDGFDTMYLDRIINGINN